MSIKGEGKQSILSMQSPAAFYNLPALRLYQ